MSGARNKWLVALASLTYPANPGHAAAAFLAYLPFLDDLPDAAFTRGSLEAVVSSDRKMAIPALNEVRGPLGAWWRENRTWDALPAPAVPPDYDRFDGQPPEQVRKIVRAMVAEAHSHLQPSHRADDGSPKHQTKPLSDGHLLRVWQAMAARGEPCAMARAAALRAKMKGEVLV